MNNNYHRNNNNNNNNNNKMDTRPLIASQGSIGGQDPFYAFKGELDPGALENILKPPAPPPAPLPTPPLPPPATTK